MVETWDDLHEGSLELDLSQRVVLKQCLDVRLVGNLPWREEIISQESLTARDLTPVVVSLLHAEKFLTGINAAERLASRELLQALVQGRVYDSVGVASERDGLLSGVRRPHRRSQVLGHADLQLDIGDELLSIFALLGVLRSAQVIERRPHEFKLLDRSRHEVVLEEFVVRRRVQVLLLVACGLPRRVAF